MTPTEQIAKAKRGAKLNKLRREFNLRWQAIGGPSIGEEVTFTNRRWRFDYAHTPARVAIELDGGIWNNGGHVRGVGFRNDRLKDFDAIMLGWVVIRLTDDMITCQRLTAIAALIRERAARMGDAYEGVRKVI